LGSCPQPFDGGGTIAPDRVAIVIESAVVEDGKIELGVGIARAGSLR
jgi:hypothetical protein